MADCIISEEQRSQLEAMFRAAPDFVPTIHNTRAALSLLAGLPKVPGRVLDTWDSFCPKCGHNRDKSSVSSIGKGNGLHSCQMCGSEWVEQAQP